MSPATLAVRAPRAFVASVMQARFFDWVEKGSGSAILKAVAGSGKSTSVVRAMARVPESATVIILAFNASAAKDLKTKIVELGAETGRTFRNVEAATFHSKGFRALCKRWGKDVKVEVDGGKVRKILKDRLSERELEMYGDFVAKLVSFAKGVGIGIPGLTPDVEAAWKGIVASQDMWLDDEDATEERGIEIARKALLASNRKAETEKWIDFDDQLYLPLLWNLRLYGHDWVVVDEAQDTNPVRRAFARKLLRPGGRFVAVGDPCQPAGTLVTMADGSQTPIEKLLVGDKVRSFSSSDSSFVQSGRRINGITEKPYAGWMTVAKSGDSETRYTANHYCYALLAGLAKKWCVYAMRKGSLWRVGTTKVQQSNGTIGLSSRRRIERADDIWMLATFDTERAAKTYEFKVSTEYGIPELLFRAPGKKGTESWLAFQAAIDAAWASLEAFALGDRAVKLLTDHGRDPNYSFNELATTGISCVTRPMKIRACNLMTGMAALRYSGKAHYDRSMFEPMTVRREWFTGSVWSLDVEKDHTYIADGIATFNCQAIYGFTGASADAMDLIAAEFKTIELPLTVSYRCPKAVGELARSLVPYFEVCEDAPEGSVEHLKEVEVLKLIGPGDAILCRQTAPLISLAFSLIAQGRGVFVLGRDVGAGLSNLIKKLNARGVDVLLERLDAWLAKELAKAMKEENPRKAEAAEDRVAAIKAIADAMPERDRTVPGLLAKIDDLFRDGAAEDLITLATEHKSKGREWRRVAILKPELSPSKAAKTEAAYEQELNLIYVAYTRAMEALYFIISEARR